ncbi:uracil-DNA glycosylase [Aquisalimonas sp.]|uniref:uracil-DNA glycosylase n=1 Tax=unclassified Aquisalimonas TaxID=2644645 RepID=UPI0025BAB167|nr:uracil-DNA glycosylase [Aquisalimonas sp.]
MAAMSRTAPEKCTACALCETRTQVVLPDGPACGLLAVGEAPGHQEDVTGVGFAGSAGRTLDRVLAEHGLGRDAYARTNIVRCRPPDNRRPRRAEIDACSPWLTDTLRAFTPGVLLAVGHTATKHLLPYWKDNHLGRIRTLLAESPSAGDLPCYRGVPVVPMPHTSGLSWNQKQPDGTPVSHLGRSAVALAVALASRSGR